MGHFDDVTCGKCHELDWDGTHKCGGGDMATKLQTIDEIMEGKVPGSVRIRGPKWAPDSWFTPHYRCHDGKWRGMSEAGYDRQYDGSTANYEVVRPKTAYYMWVRIRKGDAPYVPGALYTDEPSIRAAYTNDPDVKFIRLDHTRIEIEKEEE